MGKTLIIAFKEEIQSHQLQVWMGEKKDRAVELGFISNFEGVDLWVP